MVKKLRITEIKISNKSQFVRGACKMTKTVVIADDEPITRMDLTEILSEAGYNVVGEASDGFDAVEICRKLKPDLILMDIKMPLLDGLKASKIINNENLAGCIVLLTAYSGKNFIEEAKMAGVMGYVVKPINENSLLPAIEIAISKGNEIKEIKNESLKNKQSLEDRKKIEKAKGILMKHHGLDEKQAYDRIRKISMDKRCQMKNIAEIIILNSEI